MIRPQLTIFNKLKSGMQVGDDAFDAIFPVSVRALSESHFTPVDIAIAAARYLAEQPEVRVLDIGSGSGKFCLVGAACTDGHFTGVELRENLFDIADLLALESGLTNVHFIHADIKNIDFGDYQAFYLFNPFYEHIFKGGRIDDDLPLSKAAYDEYVVFVRDQLSQMPRGTRVVTFHGHGGQVPVSYRKCMESHDERLVMWEKG